MSAIILAGGKSERMGTPKADLRLGGKSLLEWVVQAVEQVSDEIIIVAPSPPASTPKQARMITDETAGCGPLGGLCAGLETARDEVSFVSGCDTPFLSVNFVRGMLNAAVGYDAAVPDSSDGLHPLCAVYTKTCLPAIREVLQSGERRVTSFYPHVKVRLVNAEELRRFDKPSVYPERSRRITPAMDEGAIPSACPERSRREVEGRQFDPDLLSLFNVNTPADFAAAEQLLASGIVINS